MKPVGFVIGAGAGAGMGGNVAKRFALDGYHAVLCRSSDQAGFDSLVQQIGDAGGEATGQLLNATDDGTIEALIEALIEDIESNIGPIEVAIYNLGAQIGDRPLAGPPHKTFELGWRLGTFGLYRLAYALTPHMEARGNGTFLVTSATSVVRGNRGQHSHGYRLRLSPAKYRITSTASTTREIPVINRYQWTYLPQTVLKPMARRRQRSQP